MSCGGDGAVYEWEVLTTKRISENVLKMCSYTSLSLSLDGKTTYAVGSDRTLKEISDSQVFVVLLIVTHYCNEFYEAFC